MSVDWGDAPTFAAAVIAMGAAGVASWQAREAKLSRQAAQAAVGEARRSADAAEHANQLTEQQMADSAPPKVAWLISQSRHTYTLRNVGTDEARDVTVDTDRLAGLLVLNAEPTVCDLPAGTAMTFMLAPDLENSLPAEIWVTWQGSGGPVPVPLP